MLNFGGIFFESLIKGLMFIVIVLFDQAKSGKLTKLTSALQTYLFSIGKRKLIDILRKKNRQLPLVDSNIPEPLDESLCKKIELNHRQIILKQSIDELGGNVGKY